ncbi:MAG: antitoxin VbhA family protein, partial [Peptococcaceae bacterium]|nr:antitoxin VbhA family protein [Peptococcaceae bacterium]
LLKGRSHVRQTAVGLKLTSGSGEQTFHEATFRFNKECKNFYLIDTSQLYHGYHQADWLAATKQERRFYSCKSYYTRGMIMDKAKAWDYALGIIKVDGLEPSEEFLELVEKEKKGEITDQDIKNHLDKKYKMKGAKQ